jgi:hypothetical protein
MVEISLKPLTGGRKLWRLRIKIENNSETADLILQDIVLKANTPKYDYFYEGDYVKCMNVWNKVINVFAQDAKFVYETQLSKLGV